MSVVAPRRSTRRRVVGTLCGALLAALVWSGAAPASAHVSLVSAVPVGDGTTRLTFEFDHGCDVDVGTTGLDLTAAAGVTYLAAEAPDGWTAALSPTSVRWDGPAVPDGDRAQFTVRAEVVGDPGDTVHLPVVQRCEQDAAYAWVDIDPASETPAPSLVLTAAVVGGGGDQQTGAGPLAVLLTVVVGGAGLGAVGAVAARRQGLGRNEGTTEENQSTSEVGSST